MHLSLYKPPNVDTKCVTSCSGVYEKCRSNKTTKTKLGAVGGRRVRLRTASAAAAAAAAAAAESQAAVGVSCDVIGRIIIIIIIDDVVTCVTHDDTDRSAAPAGSAFICPAAIRHTC